MTFAIRAGTHLASDLLTQTLIAESMRVLRKNYPNLAQDIKDALLSNCPNELRYFKGVLDFIIEQEISSAKQGLYFPAYNTAQELITMNFMETSEAAEYIAIYLIQRMHHANQGGEPYVPES